MGRDGGGTNRPPHRDPGDFLADIQSSTPPEAAGQALVDFANVELDAGEELVRLGAR